MTTALLVGHVSPDMDCIGALWLLTRYDVYTSYTLVFVSQNDPNPSALADAAAVVDVGREHDPPRGRFDHHQDGSLPSATRLVYDYLARDIPFVDPQITDIELLVRLIDDGDFGREAARPSYEFGPHAILNSLKDEGILSDEQLCETMFVHLDYLAAGYHRWAAAARSLKEHLVYRSDDGRLVALKNAPREAASAARDAGAELVLWLDEGRCGIGIERARESTVDCGALVEQVLALASLIRWGGDHRADLNMAQDQLIAELTSWYRDNRGPHPGYFAARGTPTAPSTTPVTVDICVLAKLFDAVWSR